MRQENFLLLAICRGVMVLHDRDGYSIAYSLTVGESCCTRSEIEQSYVRTERGAGDTR